MKQLPFYLIIIAVFLGAISPDILAEGMFMDGLMYAVISKNLANGLGSFWYLHFSETFMPDFHEHPPLAFGIQSLFFRFFGDSIFIEKFYSVGTFFATGIIITRIWKHSVIKELHYLAWLPLLLFAITPVVIWCAHSNMLENTMMIFTSLSVLFQVKALKERRTVNLIFAGLMLFLAFLTKGFTALFPLIFLSFAFLTDKEYTFIRLCKDIIWLLSAFCAPFLILYIVIPESIDSLLIYLDRQVVRSIKEVSTVDSRFWIIKRLFNELTPHFVLIALVFITTIKNKKPGINYASFLPFLLLGLSGVIPITISMKQSGFYILATFPFFALAVGLLLIKRIDFLVSKINWNGKGYKIFRVTSFGLLIVSCFLCFKHYGTIRRDKDMIHDVKILIEQLPHNQPINIQSSLFDNWALHGYFYRYADISLDANQPYSRKYVLSERAIGADEEILTKYRKKTDLNLKAYHVYEMKTVY